MAERLIGMDSGGTMTKVGLYDLDGTEIAVESRPNEMTFPAPRHRGQVLCIEKKPWRLVT